MRENFLKDLLREGLLDFVAFRRPSSSFSMTGTLGVHHPFLASYGGALVCTLRFESTGAPCLVLVTFADCVNIMISQASCLFPVF